MDKLPAPPDDYHLVVAPRDPHQSVNAPLPSEVPMAVRKVAYYLGVAAGSQVAPPCKRSIGHGFLVPGHELPKREVEMGWTFEVGVQVFQVPAQCLSDEMALAGWARQFQSSSAGTR